MARHALIRRPGPRLAEGLVRGTRPVIDVGLALKQWQGYVETLHAAGWSTTEVPPADDCPDAVFVEDTVVVYGDLAVITRPGAPSRRAETAGVEETLRDLGYRIAHIHEPGTLDGGDVLKYGGTVWVGRSERTNSAGIEQLGRLLGPFGPTVVAVPVHADLHLKSAVTALPDGTVIGCPPLLDSAAIFGVMEAVPEPAGAHVVLLDDGQLLMSASAPVTAEAFRRRGYTVAKVDISEFEKLDGCVTCLSVRLRGLPG